MQITQQVRKIVEAKKLPEDMRQDVYVELLESETPHNLESVKAWVTTICNRVRQKTYERGHRRATIEQTPEWQTAVSEMMPKKQGADLTKYMERDDVLKDIENLSKLLKDTLELTLEGLTPKEIAEQEGVDVNVIYQRIWQVKKIISGDN